MSELRYASTVRPRAGWSETGWAVLNALQAVYILLWSALWITVALLVTALTWRRGPALALARRVWAPGLLAIAVTLEVEGRERVDFSRPHLFVANHQSWADIPALFVALKVPLLFMAKRELARVPFLGWYIQAMGMVFVERSARAAGAASVGQAAERLGHGWSVLSFPEGTRSRDGRVHTFKSAGFAAAIEAGVPVVPVALEGAGRIIPPGGSFRIRPGRVRVVVGEPIPTAGLRRDDRAALGRQAERAVAELLLRQP
ncbi:MAG: 1-acyl-sn-glycerol-3-phosphate acyltransferase [Acidobacteriota bacterium]|jgi:1-acyl-sn-glycerol-3-phosphate acyltransferase|nr:1-acyl-sn-glycerol-3-phosphate acyltransferase [Acidobacteriota bacterium]